MIIIETKIRLKGINNIKKKTKTIKKWIKHENPYLLITSKGKKVCFYRFFKKKWSGDARRYPSIDKGALLLPFLLHPLISDPIHIQLINRFCLIGHLKLFINFMNMLFDRTSGNR